MCIACVLSPMITLFLVVRSLEEGTSDSSGLGDLFQSHTQHLSQKHLDFFRSAPSTLSSIYSRTSSKESKQHLSKGHTLRSFSINFHFSDMFMFSYAHLLIENIFTLPKHSNRLCTYSEVFLWCGHSS